jgi:L-serine deaminase
VGAAALRCGPHLSSQPGSAALGGAGLAVLVALVAGLLTATRLLAVGLLVATAVGGLIKTNASIAGAEVDCQGEVGSASSMAVASVAEALGGTPAQVENAARMALWGEGRHAVSLDTVIETMRQTGEDMLAKYKETSRGGLAVNVVEC